MDGGSWQLFIIFFLFMILAGFFAAAESAFSSVNKIRIKTQAEEGNKRAKFAWRILDGPDKALTAILIGNNIAHIAAASVATLFATRLYLAGKTGALSKNNVTLLCTLLTTAIVFLCSEMIPKTLATDKCESVALALAPILHLFMKCIAPLIFFFNGIASLATKWLAPNQAPTATEEELYDIVDTIEEEGVMDEEQTDLLRSALDFSNITVSDVMTMARDMLLIDETMPTDAIVNLIRTTTHSRIPVFSGTRDNIIGILSVRSFIRDYLNDRQADVHNSLLEPFFVSSTTMIDDLLTSMRARNCYLAMISDESGKTVGLITIEDLLEELVGEIWDEEDTPNDRFVNLGGNRFLVDTHLMMGDVLGKIGIPCPDSRTATRPVLSWMVERLGKLPDENTVLFCSGIEITPETFDGDRVTKVVFRLTDSSASAVSAESEEAVQ